MKNALASLATVVALAACSHTAPAPAPSPNQPQGAAERARSANGTSNGGGQDSTGRNGSGPARPKPYNKVITADAKTRRGMFLTHQDDVADHRKFRERFGCERILHEADADFAAERLIEGQRRRATI